MKLKPSLIVELFCNLLVISNWDKNLNQLITVLCEINLTPKKPQKTKPNSLMIEI